MEESFKVKGQETDDDCFKVPDDVIEKLPRKECTPVLAILDYVSLVNYPNSKRGGYYKSRDEITRDFYETGEYYKQTTQYTEAKFYIAYKEDGVCEFLFDHFVVSYDRRIIYAVYVFNTTIS